MHNSPNRGVNYHIFQNKGNYPVIPIYAARVGCGLKNPNSGKVVALPPGLQFNLSHSDLILGKTTC